MMSHPIKFFVCGQVDSGKSTLIGHLLHQSGAVPRLDVSSSEATKFSDLLDVDQSERDRGMTQFSSNNAFTYNNIAFDAIDTPGHLMYIRELINSISTNKGSIGCLLVSAIKSEFDGMFRSGTTKEDAILMRCCGVNHIIVLLNKIDKERAEAETVRAAIEPWISTLGFKSVTFCAISGYHGTNLFTRADPDQMSFLELLVHVNARIKRNHQEKTKKKKDKCKLDFRTFELDRIVATGYKSVFHVVEHPTIPEVGGEIVRIVDGGIKKEKPYFKSNESVLLYIQLDEQVELFEGQRLILRDGMKTIGFGYVMFS